MTVKNIYIVLYFLLAFSYCFGAPSSFLSEEKRIFRITQNADKIVQKTNIACGKKDAHEEIEFVLRMSKTWTSEKDKEFRKKGIKSVRGSGFKRK